MGDGPRSRGSIRYRIMVPYLVLIVVMVALTGLACGDWAARRAKEQCLDRGRGIAETLRRSHFPLTGPVLDQLKGLGGAEFALIDGDAKVVSSTLDPGATLGPIEAEGSDLSFQRSCLIGSTPYRVAVLDRPTGLSSRRSERLLILLPEPALRSAEWEARRAALGLSLVSAALAAGLATWIGRTLARPLSAILRAIRQIGQGQLRPTGLPARNDEIGELAEGVAQMAGWLRRLQDEQVQTERLRLIRQLSAGLAHGLRNPLTAARMTLQIFIERNRDRDTEPLSIALDELGRMERQVRRFLQLARPEPPTFEIADLGPIVCRTVAGLAVLADHHGVSVVVETAPDLPPARIDPDQIGEAIANLVANALDAAGQGGKVRVTTSSTGDCRLAISVEDDGPGISPGIASRLFEPFVTSKPEGVGLGLALCLALVTEHGGTIETGRSGGWTRFRLTLPAASPGRESGLILATAGRSEAPWPT
jgi:signal transduction histidine kinase